MEVAWGRSELVIPQRIFSALSFEKRFILVKAEADLKE